ncbi:MAG: phosphatidylglycerol lysyltransferase domain-containing protein, partial [Planctomycetota bacterium]
KSSSGKSSSGKSCWKKRRVSQSHWASEQNEVSSPVDQRTRLELMRNFGDFSLAYSTAVQPRLFHCGDNDGYVAWRARWGVTFALGDPVTEKDRVIPLLQRFIHERRGLTGQGPTFCQISRNTARRLHEMGYFVNEMGVDTTLYLREYDFAGKEKEWLRYAANWTRRRNFKIRECTARELPPETVEEVSEAWRRTRTVKRKEVRFLNRPIVLDDEKDVRKFYLFDADEKLLAFVFLDPLYRDGELIGYVTAFKRRHPDAPQYGEQAIMKHIIETLKEEDVSQLKLGLSPMAYLQDRRFRHSRLSSRAMQWCFDSGIINNWFYNVQGHAGYKRRFRGEEEKAYIASPVRFDLIRLCALVGLCGVA